MDKHQRQSESDIEVALARPVDCVELADLSRIAIEYGLNWRWKPSRILDLIRDKESSVIVARTASGELTGFAAMEFHQLHGHINLLATQLRFRRQGVGQRLIQWLEASARVAGLNYLTLEVRSQNAGAVKFYETNGYTIQLLKSGYYEGREDAYRMSHELIPADIAARRP